MTPADVIRALDLQQRQSKEAASKGSQKLYTGLGVLAGAGIGYGLMRLLRNQTVRRKIATVVENLGDQYLDEVQEQLARVLAQKDLPEPPFSTEPPTIKDAEFLVVDKPESPE